MATIATIDQYSVAAIPIEMYFNDTSFGVATAFTWTEAGESFLVTNWHNVSGRDPNTGGHLSSHAGEPNRLRVWFNVRNQLGNKIAKCVNIRNEDGNPLWWIHPQHGNKIDVVVVPLNPDPDVEMYPINTLANNDLLVQVGMDVFVLGYPFGIGPGGFPIWNRGSVGSEPELVPHAQLHVFVDTASRPGMSGSPVIRRSWGSHMMANGNISIGVGSATKFVGIYSGRIVSSDPLDAHLGLTWPASFVSEIISGRQLDA
jgi:hypothetical protein